MATPSQRPHTDAVIATLEAANLTVGRSSGEGLSPPYVVVYPISGGTRWGPLDAPHDDADLVYQITCVGAGPEQAEWVADVAVGALLAGITVSGRSIALSRSDFGSASVLRDDDVQPALYYCTPRFRFMSVPT